MSRGSGQKVLPACLCVWKGRGRNRPRVLRGIKDSGRKLQRVWAKISACCKGVDQYEPNDHILRWIIETVRVEGKGMIPGRLPGGGELLKEMMCIAGGRGHVWKKRKGTEAKEKVGTESKGQESKPRGWNFQTRKATQRKGLFQRWHLVEEGGERGEDFQSQLITDTQCLCVTHVKAAERSVNVTRSPRHHKYRHLHAWYTYAW